MGLVGVESASTQRFNLPFDARARVKGGKVSSDFKTLLQLPAVGHPHAGGVCEKPHRSCVLQPIVLRDLQQSLNAQAEEEYEVHLVSRADQVGIPSLQNVP